MQKIATHNSATGNKSYSWTSLFTIFSKCQNKTLVEQYNVGVRYFDIRVKKTKRGWVCAHGLWESKKPTFDLLKELNDIINDDVCYITLMYEGTTTFETMEELKKMVESTCPKLTIVYIGEKKPKWKQMKTYKNVKVVSKFKGLDFSTWHTYLPIPFLWKKIYFDNVEFNEEYFTMVDFI